MQNVCENASTRRLKGGNKKLLIGALVLTIGAFVSKFLGAFYRFPLTNILSSNGMGIYQMIYPLYSLLLVLSSSGIPVALGVIIAEGLERKQFAYVRKVEKVSLAFVVIVGFFLSLCVYLFSGALSSLQGNELGRLGYMALAPSILFVSVISGIRGIFQGRQNMVPTALSQICEQVVKIVFGIILAKLFIDKGIEYAVMGALLAVTISELVSLVFLLILFKKRKREIFIISEKESFVSNGQVIKDLIKIALPITITSAVLPLSLFFDSVVIINLLKTTMSIESATSLYGVFSGVVMTLINLPVVVSTSMSTSLIPTLTKAICMKDIKEQKSVVATCKEIVLWVSIPCMIFFIVAGLNIIELVFSSSLLNSEILLASKLLAFQSVTTILLSFLQLYSSVLQCYKEAIKGAFILICGVIIKTIFIIFLTKSFGIYSVCAGYVFGYLFSFALYFIEARKFVKTNVSGEIIKVVMSTINAVLLFFILKNVNFSFILTCFACIVLYLVHMFIFDVFKKLAV